MQSSNVSMPSFIILSVLKGACMGLRGLKRPSYTVCILSHLPLERSTYALTRQRRPRHTIVCLLSDEGDRRFVDNSGWCKAPNGATPKGEQPRCALCVSSDLKSEHSYSDPPPTPHPPLPPPPLHPQHPSVYVSSHSTGRVITRLASFVCLFVCLNGAPSVWNSLPCQVRPSITQLLNHL